jgi:regulator of protease activity HflC (stomatin/prohibitin superfamily)
MNLRLKLLMPIAAIISLEGCYTHIESGHVGVEVNSCSGGGVNDTPVSVGYHMTGMCTDIIEFPVFQQTMVLTKSSHEGSAEDESINVTSSEGLPIGVDSSISFTVDEAKAPHIYKKYRKDLDQIQKSFMRQSVREALQETFAKYTAQQLYSDKKEMSRAEVQGLLTKKLATDGFNVTQFTVNETRVPHQVLDAINNKVAMTQQAQQAEQAVRKTEAESKQKVAQAEGEAQAVKLKADAEAYANGKVTSSITPTLIRYKMAERWDGHLSQYSGSGASFMLQMNDDRVLAKK